MNTFYISGLTQLKKDVQQDFRKFQIKTLCTSNDGKVEILRFHSAAPLMSFAANFHVMVQVFDSDLFLVYWRVTMDTVISSKPTITLDDIPQVWAGAVQECQKLLTAVKAQTIKLVVVDKQFKPYCRKNLESQLINLHRGVCHYTGVSPANENKEVILMRSAARRILLYWDICSYRDTANVFLKIRDALNLTGDFGDVEKLTKEVFMH